MVILTEKDTVAKSIAEALGAEKTGALLYEVRRAGIKIVHAQGHLYRLADPEDYDEKLKTWSSCTLPILPANFLYRPEKGKKEMRDVIKKAVAEEAEAGGELIIATDSDREGEVIARLILMHCRTDGLKISRYWVSESMEKDVVLQALKERKDDSQYDSLAAEGIETKKSDWIFGINLTRAYTILNKSGVWSLGRVQSAALREISEREKEIAEFRPEPYMQLKAVMDDGGEGMLLNSATGGTAFRAGETAEAAAFVALTDKTGRVMQPSSAEEKEKPPRLYSTSELLADAYRLYGIDVDRCLDIMEELYNTDRALSYPRTKSHALGDHNVETARKVYGRLASFYAEKSCSADRITADNRRVFCTADTDGHHGLIPEKQMRESDSEKYRVWKLVADRFMMQFSPEWVKKRVKYTAEIHGYRIAVEGMLTVAAGWTDIDRTVERKEEKPCPERKEGETVKAVRLEKIMRKTQPPKHYTQGTLMTWMENPKNEEGVSCKSIGTDATRAAIIKTLFDRGYVQTVKGHIEMQDHGTALMTEIAENPPLYDCIGVGQTTEWDDLVRHDPEQLTKLVAETVKKSVELVRQKMKTAEERETFGRCPVCGKDIWEGEKNWYCSGYRDGCKVSVAKKIMGNTIGPEQAKKLFTAGRLEKMHGIKTDGSETDFMIQTDSQDGVKFTYLDNEPVCACPYCGSDIMQYKKSFTCRKNTKEKPQCDFILWKDAFGGRWTADMVKKICSGETLKNVDCSTKDGKSYTADFRIDREQHELVKISRFAKKGETDDGKDED